MGTNCPGGGRKLKQQDSHPESPEKKKTPTNTEVPSDDDEMKESKAQKTSKIQKEKDEEEKSLPKSVIE